MTAVAEAYEEFEAELVGADLEAPVKKSTPQNTMSKTKKFLFWHLQAAIFTFWTIPWVLGGIVGLVFFILPGLLMFAIGSTPLALLFGWYHGDTFFKEKGTLRRK